MDRINLAIRLEQEAAVSPLHRRRLRPSVTNLLSGPTSLLDGSSFYVGVTDPNLLTCVSRYDGAASGSRSP
jgi:hypothetical protein